MFLYEFARKVNRKLKEDKKRELGRYLSPVRRIERVYPIRAERVCAMTFDDGPSALAPQPDVSGGVALTKHLVDTLRAFECAATFNIVGDTSENYPDRLGKEGKFYWGGVKYDHYPDFGADSNGGARNCPELVQAMADAGCELSNHGYRHLLFGFSPVYSRRSPFHGIDEVVEDLNRLHTFVSENIGIEMKMARPPHYIDGIAGGFTSYDAYERMGYHYMAASFDGGGWMPQTGGYDEEVRKMVSSLERALDKDPDVFNGQIIFQKDGCNMSRGTPVASALGPQLELLKKYGYRVTTVSDLIGLSPFEDLPQDHPCFASATELSRKGYTVGYRNNTFRPDEKLTFGELCAILSPKDAFSKRLALRQKGLKSVNGIPLTHMYSTAIDWARGLGVNNSPDAVVDSKLLSVMLRATGARENISQDGLHTHASAVIEIAKNL